LRAGKRVKVGEKKNKTDFALWKFSDEPGVRQQEWKSPWGLGFPGWHVECSAMSSKYLGKQFDIHTGGQEHIPVHHTNEIAQSESAFGKKPWVNYWIHFAWLLFKGEKVSKSKGGLYTLSELEEKKYDALAFRYLCLTTHYRKPLNFTVEVLNSSMRSYLRLKNIITELKKSKNKKNKKNIEIIKQQFLEIIDNDFNTSNGLSFLWEILRDNKLNDSEKYELALDFDKVLGLDLDKESEVEIPNDVKKIIDEREKAREKKDWKKADELRKKINKLGYIIDDVGGETKVKKND
jgi:cysteinyl-tRNA synthetase